jgi:hypothetical protein
MLSQLLLLLLPPAPDDLAKGLFTTCPATATSSTGTVAIMAAAAVNPDLQSSNEAAEQQQQQQQAMEWTEKQQSSAVQFVVQLLAAGLLTWHEAYCHLLIKPLQMTWHGGWQYISLSQLKLLLQLTQGFLLQPNPASSKQSTAAAAAAAELPDHSKYGADSALSVRRHNSGSVLPVCRCPLVLDAARASLLLLSNHYPKAATAAAEAVGSRYGHDCNSLEQQQQQPGVKWLLLGLCCQKQLLVDLAVQQHQLMPSALAMADAALEALVTWLAGVGLQLAVLEDQQAGVSAQLPPALQSQPCSQHAVPPAPGEANALDKQPDAQHHQHHQHQQQQHHHHHHHPWQRQQQCRPVVVISTSELQQLSWQQRMLMSSLLLPPANKHQAQPEASQQQQPDGQMAEEEEEEEEEEETSSCLQHLMLLPASLAETSSYGAATAAVAGSTPSQPPQPPQQQLVHVQQLLLDCCHFAAASDQHAAQLASAMLTSQQTPSPTAAAAVAEADVGGRGAAVQAGGNQYAAQVAARLAAAVAQCSWQLIRQGSLLALGRFLPFAAEAAAARVLLQLFPPLLWVKSVQQQQQQCVTIYEAAKDPCYDTAYSSSFQGAVWVAEVQLLCRAVVVLLTHSRWLQPTCVAGPRTGKEASGTTSSKSITSSSNVTEVEVAQQAAAEQCFRHISMLVMQLLGEQRTAAAAAAAPLRGSGNHLSAITTTTAISSTSRDRSGSPDFTESDNRLECRVDLLRVCVQQICGMVSVLEATVDCQALQVLLLQLLTQLCHFRRLAAALTAHARGAADASSSSSSCGGVYMEQNPARCTGRLPAVAPATIGGGGAAVTAAANGASATATDAAGVETATDIIEDIDGSTGAELQGSLHLHTVTWQQCVVCAGLSVEEMLQWLRQQLRLLPPAMRQLLSQAIVALCEAQLTAALGRGMTDAELDEVELALSDV